jgi:uncharacterized membrane protein
MSQPQGMDREMKAVEASIQVEVPVRTAYNQWTQFEEFPEFMEGVESVTQIDDTHTHWVAQIAGKREEWDAEITRQVPDQEIDWVGLGDADNRGRILFESAGAGTRVTLMLDYDPDGAIEKLGDALGLVRRRVEGDLNRFKAFIEARGTESGGWRGEIHASEA